MDNWREEYKTVLKGLYKEDYFYLESYLEQFIEAQIEKAKEEVIVDLIKKIEENDCDSISLELLKEINLSKLKY